MIRLKPRFEFKDGRGIFKEIIRGNEWKELNIAVRKKGVVSGSHYHKKSKECFYVLKGQGKLDIKNIKENSYSYYRFKTNDLFIVEPFELHTFTYEKKTTFVILFSRMFDKKKPDTFKL